MRVGARVSGTEVSRLFGTDGVRGVANADLTPELAFRVGRAGASVLGRGSERHRPIVVGRDTRVSGTMLEAAIVAGITSVGRDAISLGIVPTPGVACVTLAEGAAAGVVISASHNPIEDNGIKFFGADGFKLSDTVEEEIEAALDAEGARPVGAQIGTARLAQNLTKHYYRLLEQNGADLTGMHVVIDGAYGAAYAIAPYVFRKLGATVTELHCEADGARINVECGATDLARLRNRVVALTDAGERAVGVAFDGDADRAMFVDERGETVTGDHVLYALACKAHACGELGGSTVVGTVMTNIGAERALSRRGISLRRAPVGDRYVLETMREGGYVLGGEQSGHVINLLRNTTGDGPLTAVQVLSLAAASNGSLRSIVEDVSLAPQLLVNVRSPRGEVLDRPAVRAAIEHAQKSLGREGRILVRVSGTEPLLRIMAEGDDLPTIERLIKDIERAIERELETPVKT